MKAARPWITGIVILAVIAALGYAVARRLRSDETQSQRPADRAPAPVEVAPIERGTIINRRTFSGTLEAAVRVTISPKIGGRIVTLTVDIADTVRPGDLLAQLESSELDQAIRFAEAERAVTAAALVEAENALTIARRELDRAEALFDRGIASESQLDTARADHLSRSSAVEVAQAQRARAESNLQTARIRRGYADIHADWGQAAETVATEGNNDRRVIAERFVEIGDTVSANTPLLSIIDLDPIVTVIYVTERDYAMLDAGQKVSLTTDAYPGRQWTGAIDRVAPLFREGSRQARVEIRVPNPDADLKPGMFARVQAILGEARDATIVPVEALDRRQGRDVVFIVPPGTSTARLTPVRVGITDAGRVQITAADNSPLEGSVVTLGHQLLGEETVVSMTRADSSSAPAPEAASE